MAGQPETASVQSAAARWAPASSSRRAGRLSQIGAAILSLAGVVFLLDGAVTTEATTTLAGAGLTCIGAERLLSGRPQASAGRPHLIGGLRVCGLLAMAAYLVVRLTA